MKRLILFDIDGTILHTHGAAKRAFHRAMLEVYGTAGPIDTHSFDGKTDPQIARELLTLAALEDDAIDTGLDSLWARYLGYLGEELAAPGQQVTLLPGVLELIEALEARAGAVIGLLTGNIAGGARIKLGAVGLADRFGFGAYGSDHELRAELPAIAAERACGSMGYTFRGPEIVVIGDTPHDVTCGRALGVRALGVTTGRHPADELHAAGAAAVFPDLADTDRVLDFIFAPVAVEAA